MERNGTITAVAGLVAGHWTNAEAATGCTAIVCPAGAVAGVDVRGGAPGTRETDLMRPTAAADVVHAVVLSGGSAFGLAAADGAMRWLAERRCGFDVGVACVPLVPAAVIFDLRVGSADVRPDAAAGYAACEAASELPLARGCVGAGTGAAVGHVGGTALATKSGLGSACISFSGGPTIGAAVAVNAFGDVVDPLSGEVIAGARAASGGFVDTAALLRRGEITDVAGALQGTHTVIGVVATDAVLSKPHAARMALMAHDGLARAIRPAHTMLDGDTVFALATGASGEAADINVIGALAAEVFMLAVVDAVRSATSLAGLPCAADLR